MRSMTGFGRAAGSSDYGRFQVEVRSVNHRFCEVSVRLPRPLSGLEERVRRAVQQAVARGRVEVTVAWDRSEADAEPAAPAIKVDNGLAIAYYNKLRKLSAELGIEGNPSLEMIARLPEVIAFEPPELDPDQVWPALQPVLQEALRALQAMREREGAALAAVLGEHLAHLSDLRTAIAQRAGELPKHYQQRLERRLAELMPAGAPVDPARLALEVALLADRSDISEELARWAGHLQQFAQHLDGAGRKEEPVGRALDFLTQELLREVNTTGSKAGDLPIAQAVLAAKAELEKIREQVQNVE